MPTVEIDGLRVDYTDAGSGVAVVFIAGLGGSKDWFHYQTSGLSDHYRVISYDLRRARRRDGCTLARLVTDLEKLLARLHVHLAVIAGHSLGGLVALQFAALHPETCLALVLSATSPSYPELSDEELIADLLPGKVVHVGLLARLWGRLLERGTSPGPSFLRRGEGSAINDAGDDGPLGHLACPVDRGSLEARLRILRETDLAPILGGIEAPALIVAGSGQKSYMLEGCQALEQGLADSTLEVLEDADQYHFYTCHDRFNAIVADFLAHRIARP